MAHIILENLSVEFPLFGSNSRSLKKRFISQATGGQIAKDANDAITVQALKELSLKIADGDRIGLVGHNGAGKSTLLRTIAGIYKPTGGSLLVKGKVHALLEPLAGMDPEASGIENIYLRGYLLGLSKREVGLHLDDIVEFSELGDYIELPMRTYSSGMCSRLAFSIAASLKPEILLVDEHIGTGDEKFIEKIRTRTEALVEGASIFILASHDQQILRRLCRKRLTLDRGELVSVD